MSEYHVPVLLQESIDGLDIKEGGVYVDVTFGGGGHSRHILKTLRNGKLVGFDQDTDAQRNIPNDDQLIFVEHNFRYLKNFLKYHGIEKVDGILADLGVSSHDFDEAGRGFSFRFEAKLDMRMNQRAKKTAADILNNYDEKDLADILYNYGEVKGSRKIAKLIVDARRVKPINTIGEFKEIINGCVPKAIEHKYLAKVFQALRIEVNQEMEVLHELLKSSADVLAPNGRLVVITYHSLEDRMVKNFVKNGKIDGKAEADFFGRIDVPLKAINKRVIIPTDEEIKINSRARSAKLRIAEKIAK